ncbi:MAG: Unknown protein, partial [uncultured Sulfurovum sp.]
EDEKIALQFFMDSIYPFRPLIKDKQLVSEGKIWQATYYAFVHVIPNYKNIKIFYEEDQASNIYRSPIKTRPKEYQGGVKGRFRPSKFKIKKRTYNYFSNQHDSSLVRLDMSSMYYNRTQQEKLISIRAIRTNLRSKNQGYITFSYVMVVKNKKIIHWAIRDTY